MQPSPTLPEQQLAPLLADCYQQASSQATYSFAQGLILGQLSVILLLAACARWLLLDDPRRRAALARTLLPENAASGAANASGVTEALGEGEHARIIPPGREEDDTELLSRLGYDVLHQPPESCGWLNVLLAQIIRKYRAEAMVEERLLNSLSTAINTDTRPSFLGEVKITEFALGSDYPILHSVRVRPTEDLTSMRIEADFTLRDLLTIGLDTELLLNWPRALLASLPVSLALSIAGMSGTIHIEFSSTDPPCVCISLAPGYELELQVRSLLGHRTKIKDLPKVSDLLCGRIRGWFESKCVSPHYFTIPMPMPWAMTSPSVLTIPVEDLPEVLPVPVGTAPPSTMGRGEESVMSETWARSVRGDASSSGLGRTLLPPSPGGGVPHRGSVSASLYGNDRAYSTGLSPSVRSSSLYRGS